jgi:hypothetical protein
LREIYSDLTGNEPEASLTGPALRSAVSAIVQSHAIDPGAGMDLYRQIARERAGLDPAPDPHAIEPGDRLQRLSIASGDLYMQFAAESLGKERARALRQKHQGWPMTGFSSGQCPD